MSILGFALLLLTINKIINIWNRVDSEKLSDFLISVSDCVLLAYIVYLQSLFSLQNAFLIWVVASCIIDHLPNIIKLEEFERTGPKTNIKRCFKSYCHCLVTTTIKLIYLENYTQYQDIKWSPELSYNIILLSHFFFNFEYI